MTEENMLTLIFWLTICFLLAAIVFKITPKIKAENERVRVTRNRELKKLEKRKKERNSSEIKKLESYENYIVKKVGIIPTR